MYQNKTSPAPDALRQSAVISTAACLPLRPAWKGGYHEQKKTRNTKSKIVSAAWQLFYQQGYDDTTIDEIVEASGTSKGSFYHYFDSKDSLLTSLSYLFDEKYEELIETMDPSLSPIDKLIHMNHELL